MALRYLKLATVLRLRDGRTAFIERGDLLPDDADPVEVERLRARGSVEDVDAPVASSAPAPAALGEDTTDVRGRSVDALIEWLRETQPQVDDAVAATHGDPDTLRALLDAETVVSGGKPRQTIIRAVEALNADGNAGNGDGTSNPTQGEAVVTSSTVEITTGPVTTTTDATASNPDATVVTEPTSVAAPGTLPEDYNELKKLAKSLGVSAAGKKDELAERVRTHLAQQ